MCSHRLTVHHQIESDVSHLHASRRRSHTLRTSTTYVHILYTVDGRCPADRLDRQFCPSACCENFPPSINHPYNTHPNRHHRMLYRSMMYDVVTALNGPSYFCDRNGLTQIISHIHIHTHHHTYNTFPIVRDAKNCKCAQYITTTA